ncbi:hypothetical protein FNQ90_15680 [Streptomyces alkaliphilus]|uniref:Ferric oxidoreductase domain-containing protein n=1 Tax=Streptomyces alkaliphilus TaxID=1472722 RepID=A0A7W3Y2G0_9ACTN|nr:ferric reductase-like transmembrane domain-containing protein [Streptomyces alkaliphilus]MBB0245503.1 hypothetical protein [Streptomyces alkaliphilus]
MRLPEASARRTTGAYVTATALIALIVLGTAGAFEEMLHFLDFGAGVMALVCLTATVMWGLAATDRILLHPGHRLLAQAVHRGLGITGLCFLLLHIGIKIFEDRVSGYAAAIPFSDPLQPLLMGLGTMAAYLFVLVAVVGAARGVFAGRNRSRWWRGLHMLAYPTWALALVHGLYAGRPAAGWVTAVYMGCLLLAALALTTRLANRSRRHAR